VDASGLPSFVGMGTAISFDKDVPYFGRDSDVHRDTQNAAKCEVVVFVNSRNLQKSRIFHPLAASLQEVVQPVLSGSRSRAPPLSISSVCVPSRNAEIRDPPQARARGSLAASGPSQDQCLADYS
jgi:hypothetical protein